MTACAICPQTTLMKLVFLMAADTFPRRLLESQAAVTGLTGCNGMQTEQRIITQIMVKFNIGTPARLIMATLTLFTLVAFMNIVFLVTCDARSFKFVLIRILIMTLDTECGLMTATQSEPGVAIMIETDFFPAPGSMAFLALSAIATLVFIIEFMATDTGL